MSKPVPLKRKLLCTSNNKKSWQHVVYGGIAGCVAKTVVAPVERARLMAQTGAFEGTFQQTLRTIFKQEGAVGLWRGNGANCMRVFPQKGILFATNDFIKDGVRTFFKRDSLLFSCLSGASAGVVASAVTFPLDVTRMRMSATKMGNKNDVQRSFRTVFYDLFRTEGIKGLYRGIRPTVMGAVPYEGIKFGCFDALQTLWLSAMKNNMNNNNGLGHESNDAVNTEEPIRLPLYGKLVCGALAGIVAGGFMYPNDTVRRRMQVAGAMGGAEDRMFTGPIDCARDTYRSGGIRRFYRGVTPYLIRMVPNAAIQFWVYETCKEMI